MKKAKKNYVITNMVAAGNLGFEIDLYKLIQNFKNVEYEPEQFPGAILKFNEPKSTLLIFKNGKVVCVGCMNRKVIKEALEKAHKMLLPYAKKIYKKSYSYEITNMVAYASLDLNLNLFEVALGLEDVEYEPEQFPGAIVKIKKPPVSLLVFKNGKIIVAGAKNRKEIEEAIEKVKKMLKKFTINRKK